MKKNPFKLNLEDREKAFKSGEALDSHVLTVHEGSFNPECPACQELLKKKEEDAI